MSEISTDPRRPGREITLVVSGLNCTNCALSLEKHLSRIGTDGPAVDFASGRTSFSLSDPERLPQIVESIRRLGYSVSTGASAPVRSLSTILSIKLAISVLLTIPLIAAMFLPGTVLHQPLIQFTLCLPVFLIGLHHFGSSAVRSLRAGIANMDVLITVGIVAGFTASVLSMNAGLGHESLYFEAVASIVTFILLGHLVEERAVRKTTSAIESLTGLQPTEARRVVTSAGQETIEVVPSSKLEIGDRVQINTGDKVPTDATIECGSASIDESMITGESLPVTRAEGDRLIGGSVAVSGSFTAKVTAVGDDTVLSSIVRLVRDAQQRRPKIQRIGDKVSSWFVPAVLVFSVTFFALALTSFGLTVNEAIVRSLAIIVVACPCAMGLATPTAIMVALGRAARSGVLVKGGDTLERLASIEHVAFDKTGTLTAGKLQLGDLHLHGGTERQKALGMLMTLERHSSHPISKAVIERFEKEVTGSAELASITEVKGVGIEGRGPDGTTYACGGRALAKRYRVDPLDDLMLFEERRVIASVSLSDRLRPDAKEAIDRLHSLGLGTSIISGDTPERCASISSELGIDSVASEQLPDEKVRMLEELQSRQEVAYVGDGINDAPTLARASVGISLSSASDVALHSAQVVLTNGTLSSVADAVTLSRLTVRTIKQNLFWAFAYNVATIPLAAAGYLSPIVAALMMSMSDVVIVGNSLRLRYRKLR